MTATRYYRSALLVPLLMPVLVYLFTRESWLFGLLFYSLLFGGIAYIIFAIVLFIRVGKLTTTAQIQKLTWLAPLWFVPLQALTLIAWIYVSKLFNPELTDGLELLPFFALYSLSLGYAYVVLVNVGYVLLHKAGLLE